MRYYLMLYVDNTCKKHYWQPLVTLYIGSMEVVHRRVAWTIIMFEVVILCWCICEGSVARTETPLDSCGCLECLRCTSYVNTKNVADVRSWLIFVNRCDTYYIVNCIFSEPNKAQYSMPCNNINCYHIIM